MRYGQNAKLFVALRAAPDAPSAIMSVRRRCWAYTQLDSSGQPPPFVTAYAGTVGAVEAQGADRADPGVANRALGVPTARWSSGSVALVLLCGANRIATPLLIGAFAAGLVGASAAAAAPGHLAPGFANGGRLTVNGANCSALGFGNAFGLPGGKILAIGETWTFDGDPCNDDFGTVHDEVIAERFNSDGTPDPSFGSGGVSIVDIGLPSPTFDFSGDLVKAAEAPDGDIVVAAGDRVGRLLPDGELDTSFGPNGTVALPAGIAEGVAVDAQDRPVVAEAFAGGGSSFGAVRYLRTGSLDPSFGSGGRASVTHGRSDVAAAVATEPDGRVVLAGSLRSGRRGAKNAEKLAVLRLTAQGRPDGSFGRDGLATAAFSLNASANALALLPGGRVLAVGRRQHRTHSGAPVFALARFRRDGRADPSFAGNGLRTTEFGRVFTDEDEQAVAVALQRDGKAVVTGIPRNTDTAGAGIALARYLPSGRLDPKFANGGKRYTSYDPGCEDPQALAMLPSHRLVVSGTAVCYEEDSAPADGTLAVYQR